MNEQQWMFVGQVAIGDPEAREYLILRDGYVETKKGSYLLDAQAGRSIESNFAAAGNKVVVDYEHQSLGGPYAAPDGRAPAAGWITDVRYEAGRGLWASIAWNPAALKHIRNGEYAYLSPAGILAGAERRFVELWSVALTNTPASPQMEPLAAKRTGTFFGGNSMPTDDMMGANTPDMLVGELRAALRSKGVTIGDDATRDEILRAAISALTGEKDEGEKESEEIAASVRTRLGLDATASNEKVLLLLDSRLEGKGAEDQERLALRKKVEDLEGRESERRAVELVEQGIKAGKIVRGSKWAERCLALARKDAGDFEATLKELPTIIEQGRTTAPARESVPGAGEGKEEELIAAAVKEASGSYKEGIVALQSRLLNEECGAHGYSRTHASRVLSERYPAIFG